MWLACMLGAESARGALSEAKAPAHGRERSETADLVFEISMQPYRCVLNQYVCWRVSLLCAGGLGTRGTLPSPGRRGW